MLENLLPMPEKRQKIPLLLKFKRLKNSNPAEAFNSLFSIIKSPEKFKGTPNKLLLIRNDGIGDAVVTLPVIRDLKLNYPEIIIDVLASGRNKFVFDNFKFADETIEFDWIPPDIRLSRLFTLPLLGGTLQFIRYAFIQYLFSRSFRQKINRLKIKRYDAAVDLVGLKRNLLLSRLVSRFSAGPKKFIVYIMYNYYTGSNWVSPGDNDFMTKKIENTLKNAFGFSFDKKETALPLVNYKLTRLHDPIYDIIFHIGSTKLRKLHPAKEEEVIALFADRNILVVDSGETKNFLELKNNFGNKKNITFKIFNSLKDSIPDCLNSKLLLCYDGGQAHYLSQFVRTITIFGPGSVMLWRPYEFSEYSLLEKDKNGTMAVISNGVFRHIAVYHPVWCRPCFDIGCNERPCLEEISIEFIGDIIKKYCLYAN